MNDPGWDFRYLCRLFSRHEDIAVIRQDQRLLGTTLVNGIHDVLGARVHRLSATDDVGHAQAL